MVKKAQEGKGSEEISGKVESRLTSGRRRRRCGTAAMGNGGTLDMSLQRAVKDEDDVEVTSKRKRPCAETGRALLESCIIAILPTASPPNARQPTGLLAQEQPNRNQASPKPSSLLSPHCPPPTTASALWSADEKKPVKEAKAWKE
jgi:hypothetical protein